MPGLIEPYRGRADRSVDARKRRASTLQVPLANVDREDEADARRLIRVRVIDDRWRRIDRGRIIATTVVATGLMPAALLLAVASTVISGERRRDGYTADH